MAISTYKLINSYGVSKGLIDRMKHNKAITTFTINELCNTLDCNLNYIMVFVPDNKENNDFVQTPQSNSSEVVLTLMIGVYAMLLCLKWLYKAV